MSTESIQLQLRKQAQILGDLNLQLNKYMQENQQISKQIKQIENRIAKKKKIIDQQNKDKKIIHQKLIDAQNYKQQLQIRADCTPDANQDDTPNGIKFQVQEQKQIVRPASLKQYKVQQQKVQKINKQKQPETKIKKEQQKIKEQYQNTDKGQYQPPVLTFEDKSNDDSSSQSEDDKQMLENVRKKLGNTDLDEDDDD